MTGAPMPPGADAVVPIEDTRAVEGGVRIQRGRDAGDYVREAGSDVAAGAVLLPAGLRLASRHLAALAAANLIDVDGPCARARRGRQHRQRARSTRARRSLGPPPDANGIALAAAASAVGAEVVDLQLAGDDPVRLGAVFDRAIAAGAELILTSGGISMGAHEPVRQLLEPLGATRRHGRHAAGRPAGPRAVSRRARSSASRATRSAVSSASPCSSPRCCGSWPHGRPRLRATRALAAPLQSISGRRQFLRGRLTDDGAVETVAGPGSHLVAALAAADVLIDVPADVTSLPAGATVDTVDL